MSPEKEALVKRIEEKYQAIDQNPDVHLEGLVWSNPITYWDYIMPEALLGLQVQRTTLPDEMVFIMYHQINELLFKMILWEIDQVSATEKVEAAFFTEKLRRISRYFDMLSTSFDIMGDGMEVDQYMKFRNTLTPASGFQSAQYRLIEFASTELINLIDFRFRATIDRNTPYEHAYEHLYWQAAGKDHSTGKKNTLIRNFEKKYKVMFLDKMEGYNTTNLWTKFKQLPEEVKKDEALIQAMRHYDYTVNVSWVMAHYHAAAKYIGGGEATGGSDWRKYMHPRYQKRIFFPELWSADELAHWGENV
ncbi:MAG: tryptophan 2,3-dioxygenase family protein [Bacteroidota bacterium]